MRKYRIGTALVILIYTTSLTACSVKKSDSKSGDPSGSTTATAATTAKTNTPTKSEAPSFDLNPLTGQYDVTPGASVRPICVMIGNNDRSRPQCGLDKADLYVEAETEGGITRIMAVFSGTSRLPDILGPVRSARSPFVLIAQSLGAIYCHAGGSTAGTETIKKTGVSDVNALVGTGEAAFWRDAALRKSRGQEYSLMTSSQKLADRVKALKYSTESKIPSPFAFDGTPAGTGAGNKAQVTLTGAQTDSFVYHADEKAYYKFNGALDKGAPHTMMDGGQITAANVLILYDTKYSENEVTIGFRLASGSGLLVSGGASCPVQWSRTASGLKFTGEDGSALRVMPGKTYICLVSAGNKGKTVLF